MNIETNKRKKQIAILGSTGSIGTQALQVIEEHPDLYEAYALTANNRVELLIAQARKFQPEVVVIANEEKVFRTERSIERPAYQSVRRHRRYLSDCRSIPHRHGVDSHGRLCRTKTNHQRHPRQESDCVTNKETLVVAGELINQLAQQYRTPILPVDSEHSAVFQCLAGEVGNPIEKVILTASGGPFRTCTLEQLKSVTKTQALKHPNWEMGAKSQSTPLP